jgi:hypothetical protein
MEAADKVSMDIFYTHYSKFFLVWSNVMSGHMETAGTQIAPISSYSESNGSHLINDVLLLLKGIILIDKGEIRKGMSIIDDQLQEQRKKDNTGFIPSIILTKGMVYLEILKNENPIRPMTVIKNIGFMIKNVPQAEKKGVANFKRAIESAQEIGAIGTVGQAHLGIGTIHALKQRPELAKDHLKQAIHIFEKTGAYAFLKQAQQHLESLNSPD